MLELSQYANYHNIRLLLYTITLDDPFIISQVHAARSARQQGAVRLRVDRRHRREPQVQDAHRRLRAKVAERYKSLECIEVITERLKYS